MSDLYQEVILEELKHPHNYGELDGATTQATQTNPSCGDSVTVYLEIAQDTQNGQPARPTIRRMNWTGSGCAISQAATSLLSQAVAGKAVSDVLSWGQPEILDLLGLEEISIGRVKCLLLSLRTVQSTLKQGST